ncbi:hypothetical protein BB558_004000 [Smittium angustum]|uniref:Uncharacterized protein n=1 Tax=Smittium angustum TaxID=133377 RepID=A0A2U1J4F4_SMIAN|nr:hypothetical protein BB558_004000 [Smittium angustum]
MSDPEYELDVLSSENTDAAESDWYSNEEKQQKEENIIDSTEKDVEERSENIRDLNLEENANVVLNSNDSIDIEMEDEKDDNFDKKEKINEDGSQAVLEVGDNYLNSEKHKEAKAYNRDSNKKGSKKGNSRKNRSLSLDDTSKRRKRQQGREEDWFSGSSLSSLDSFDSLEELNVGDESELSDLSDWSEAKQSSPTSADSFNDQIETENKGESSNKKHFHSIKKARRVGRPSLKETESNSKISKHERKKAPLFDNYKRRDEHSKKQEKKANSDVDSDRALSESVVRVRRKPGRRRKLDIEHPNRQDDQGRPQILYFASRGDVNSCRRLIQHGAAIDGKDKKGWSVIHEASRQGNKELVKLVIEVSDAMNKTTKFLDINSQNVNGNTALHEAVKYRNPEMVELLITNGARVDIKNRLGRIPNDISDSKTISALLDGSKAALRGALIRDKAGQTRLHRACRLGNYSKAIQQLQTGMDLDIPDNAGWTPLHEASLGGHTKLVKELLRRGASVGGKGLGGDTPLHDACANGHEDVVRLLLQSGADYEAKNQNGETPLQMALNDDITNVIKSWKKRNDGKKNLDDSEEVDINNGSSSQDSSSIKKKKKKSLERSSSRFSSKHSHKKVTLYESDDSESELNMKNRAESPEKSYKKKYIKPNRKTIRVFANEDEENSSSSSDPVKRTDKSTGGVDINVDKNKYLKTKEKKSSRKQEQTSDDSMEESDDFDKEKIKKMKSKRSKDKISTERGNNVHDSEYSSEDNLTDDHKKLDDGSSFKTHLSSSLSLKKLKADAEKPQVNYYYSSSKPVISREERKLKSILNTLAKIEQRKGVHKVSSFSPTSTRKSKRDSDLSSSEKIIKHRKTSLDSINGPKGEKDIFGVKSSKSQKNFLEKEIEDREVGPESPSTGFPKVKEQKRGRGRPPKIRESPSNIQNHIANHTQTTSDLKASSIKPKSGVNSGDQNNFKTDPNKEKIHEIKDNLKMETKASEHEANTNRKSHKRNPSKDKQEINIPETNAKDRFNCNPGDNIVETKTGTPEKIKEQSGSYEEPHTSVSQTKYQNDKKERKKDSIKNIDELKDTKKDKHFDKGKDQGIISSRTKSLTREKSVDIEKGKMNERSRDVDQHKSESTIKKIKDESKATHTKYTNSGISNEPAEGHKIPHGNINKSFKLQGKGNKIKDIESNIGKTVKYPSKEDVVKPKSGPGDTRSTFSESSKTEKTSKFIDEGLGLPWISPETSPNDFPFFLPLYIFKALHMGRIQEFVLDLQLILFLQSHKYIGITQPGNKESSGLSESVNRFLSNHSEMLSFQLSDIQKAHLHFLLLPSVRAYFSREKTVLPNIYYRDLASKKRFLQLEVGFVPSESAFKLVRDLYPDGFKILKVAVRNTGNKKIANLESIKLGYNFTLFEVSTIYNSSPDVSSDDLDMKPSGSHKDETIVEPNVLITDNQNEAIDVNTKPSGSPKATGWNSSDLLLNNPFGILLYNKQNRYLRPSEFGNSGNSILLDDDSDQSNNSGVSKVVNTELFGKMTFSDHLQKVPKFKRTYRSLPLKYSAKLLYFNKSKNT